MSGETDRMLMPADVARLFGVNVKTIRKWALAGKLTAVRTLGNHRRYRESHIRVLLAEQTERGDVEP